MNEIIVDYEKHNDKRFFIPLTEAQAKTQPDIEATKKAFAILQHKTRIEQILKDKKLNLTFEVEDSDRGPQAVNVNKD